MFRKAFGNLPGDNVGILINGDKDEIKSILPYTAIIRNRSEVRDDIINDILNNEDNFQI